jgi:hypothetical protein
MADLFGISPRRNAIVLFALAGMDVVSTYLCVKAGLHEANPIIRSFYGIGFFYDSIVPGMLMHLILYWLITLLVAYAAQYFCEKNKTWARALLVGYAAVLCVISFNNFVLLTGRIISP